MEHAVTNHGAEGGVVKPTFGFICGIVDCSLSVWWVAWWGGRGVGEGRGIVGGCVNYRLCHRWVVHWLCWEGCWSVGVQLRRDVFARMEEVPSCWVGWEVGWWDVGGVQLVDTSISHVMLRGSSFVGNRGGRCGLRVCLGRGDGDSQP